MSETPPPPATPSKSPEQTNEAQPLWQLWIPALRIVVVLGIGLSLIGVFYRTHIPERPSDDQRTAEQKRATCDPAEVAVRPTSPEDFPTSVDFVVCRDVVTIDGEQRTDRRRFDFLRFAERAPLLAAQIALIRDRVRDLAAQSEQLERAALRRHIQFTCLFLLTGLLVVVSTLVPVNRGPASPETGGKLSRLGEGLVVNKTTILAVLAVFGTLQQSIAYSAQHAAFISTRHALEALAIRIENEATEAVILSQAKGGGVADVVVTAAASAKWTTELATIQKNFATAFGGSYGVITLNVAGN